MNFEQLNDLAVWRRMPTLDLDRIAAVRLMNRVDTKYLVDERRCMELLERAADQYYVQIIDDCRACRYATLYYDTPQWDMYHLHHNRRLTRQKIRTRTYVETGVTYLEVKNKSNKGRTHKRRMALDRTLFAAAATDTAAADFLRREARYAPETLSPSLATRFVRVTLVNHAMTERLTIDFDLHFDNVRAADGGNKDMNGRGDMDTISCGDNGMTGMDNGFPACRRGLARPYGLARPPCGHRAQAGRPRPLAHETAARAAARQALQTEQILHRRGADQPPCET